MMINKTLKKFGLCATVASGLLLASGCAPVKKTRGNMLQDYQLAEVLPGTDTQSDVLRKIGSPTTKAPFDENTWYYMGQKTEKKGILDPEVKEEQIIIMTFNTEGLLQTITDADGNRMELPYVRRKTPTSGNDITVMQQLIGNMGRFNTESMQEQQ